VVFPTLLVACAPAATVPLPEAWEATSLVVEGEGWEARAARATLDAERATGVDVTGVVTPASGRPPLTIDAPRTEWDLRAGITTFSGGVSATRGDVTLRADTLVVRYADAGRVDRVEADGAVVVERGDRRGEGGRAVLVASTGEITITGHPRLREGPSWLTGERIVLWLDDERAVCEGAEGAPCRLTLAGDAIR
jgi:lipopolysaccharide export system protein LptA